MTKDIVYAKYSTNRNLCSTINLCSLINWFQPIFFSKFIPSIFTLLHPLTKLFHKILSQTEKKNGNELFIYFAINLQK